MSSNTEAAKQPLVVQSAGYVHAPSEGTSAVPPPPPPVQDKWSTLPPGWSTATSPEDGRIYYWEKATGKTTWSHPSASTTVANQQSQPPQHPPKAANVTSPSWNAIRGSTRTEYLDTPWNASSRANDHQCYAVTALFLCFPIGLFAVYHSHAVNRSWEDGRYGEAVNHSRQASQYACVGTFIGAVFWLWYLFFQDGFNFDKWFQFD